ncbi:hypothetical protein JX266_012260 [Neoarthrinium moseri]|uniref:uncharacterized protein n=1 Tax=Neoarthrinium moseri TaxID=1658444 RepID=UPI001FDB929D|nr:uncharacterized protein JN550_005170 [Neoarthrinium moseri]KAI1841508.1 hypothetical protein JX266_012260 [Neoarthrinium moseri]KAI1870627.1 hypothetical protein JN550_005170 [Neoarthrinium moseri]
MPLSKLQAAWLQTSVLIALNLVAIHEMERDAFTSVWEDGAVKNLTDAYSQLSSSRDTALGLNTTAISSGNSTSPGQLSTSTGAGAESSEPFYLHSLPRQALLYALTVPFSFYWHLLLERMLPTRPRGVELHYEKPHALREKAVSPLQEPGEGQEEEVVKRWIAQGKVRRSSVSWWNTFVKWVLDLSVGKIICEVVYHLVDNMVFKHRGNFGKAVVELKVSVIWCTLTSFVSIRPLASLIGFIVIPAHQRPAFQAGMDLVASVFFSAFFRLVIPWAVKTDFVQRVLKEQAETTRYMNENPGSMPPDFRLSSDRGRLIDEL